MDLPANINVDPAGIQAILDALKASQAWKEALQIPSQPPTASPSSTILTAQAGVSNQGPSASQGSDDKGKETESSPPTSVASLLSQLQATPSLSPVEPYASALRPQTHHHLSSHDNLPFQVSDPVITSRAHAPPPQPALASSMPSQSLRSCTFQQALPHIARLSEDTRFVAEITSMKREQAEFEKRLWQERRALQRSHEEKVKLARTKAKMIGADLTQYEADALADGFRRELQKFDAERVLPAWDGLIAKQQAALESLGVPAMFPTFAPSEREKQQKVMQVLVGVAEE